MRRREDAFEHLGRDRVGEKTPPDIAALVDDPVHGGALVRRERVLRQQGVCRQLAARKPGAPKPGARRRRLVGPWLSVPALSHCGPRPSATS